MSILDSSAPSVTIPTASLPSPISSVIIAAEAVAGNYGSEYYGLSAVRFIAHPKSASQGDGVAL